MMRLESAVIFDLLDLYISKMPSSAKEKDYFYLRPFDSVGSKWYYASPVGEHKLATMVKDMFGQIGVTGKTNHSLRATGASALFEANVPEKIIQERTGHRSLKALRLYERMTDEQHLEVSSILGKRGSSEPKANAPQLIARAALLLVFQILVCLSLVR